MTWNCYQFEVNSIQRWVFGSGKLSTSVGDGSTLVSGTSKELLKATLDAMRESIDNHTEFAWCVRRVLIALSENKPALAELLGAWSLLVSRYARGLSFSIGHPEEAHAMTQHADYFGPASPCLKMETIDA